MRPVRICDILFNLRIVQMSLLTYLLKLNIIHLQLIECNYNLYRSN